MSPEWQGFLLLLLIGAILTGAAILNGDLYPAIRNWLFKDDPNDER